MHGSGEMTRWEAVKSVGGLALPVSLGRFLDRASPFLATVMLAHIDNDHLVASAIITPIQMFVLSAAVGMLNSVNVTVATECHTHGSDSEKRESIRKIVQQGLLYSGIIGLVSCGLFLLNPPISQALTDSHHISTIIKNFFYGYVPGFIPYLLMTNYSQMTIGLGKAWPSVVATGAYSLLAAGFGYAFLHGEFGFPKWDTFGLGFGFTMASCVVLAGFLVYLKCSRYFKHYIGFSLADLFGSFHYLHQLRSGVPIGLKIGFDRLSLIITTVLASRLGHAALAAQELCLQFLFITMVPLFGLATVAGKFAAQHIKRNFSTAQRIGNITLVTGLLYTVIILALYAAIPKQLASIFLDFNKPESQQIMDLFRPTILIIGAGQVCEAVRSIVAGALRGFPAPKKTLAVPDKPDTWYPMYVALVIMVVFDAIVGYGAGIAGGSGLQGVFGARSLGLFFAAGVLALRWKYQVDNHNNAVPAKSWLHAFFRGSPRREAELPLVAPIGSGADAEHKPEHPGS